MEERWIEISLEDYQRFLAAQIRIESALIYIDSSIHMDKDVVSSLLRGEVTPCTIEE